MARHATVFRNPTMVPPSLGIGPEDAQRIQTIATEAPGSQDDQMSESVDPHSFTRTAAEPSGTSAGRGPGLLHEGSIHPFPGAFCL